MVTVAKSAKVPPELEALEEGEAVLTIDEVTIDLENKYKDDIRPVIKLKWQTQEGSTFLSSFGLSLFEGKGDRGPSKLRDMLDKLGVAITDDGDGGLNFNEKALIGRKVKGFIEKTPSGWPKVSKVLRAADGNTGAASAAVGNAFPE